MPRPFFAASIAAIALIPSFAAAQSASPSQAEYQSSCDRQRSTRPVATVAGTGTGGVPGNVMAGEGDKLLGTIIGAVGGALLGNQIARPEGDCRHAYGYYDENSRWHATGVSAADARGYYDRDGGWIEGAPNGHYGADGRWLANTGQARGEGAYSAQGGWVPASANGYYDRDDQWHAGTPGGYHDAGGRWIGSVDGQAERRPDAYGYYDSQGMWHAIAVQQGRATGYYDSRGRWVSTAVPSAPVGVDTPRRSILSQVESLENHVGTVIAQGRLSRRETARAKRDLITMRSRERTMHHDRQGDLSVRNQTALQVRIDRFSEWLRIAAQ